MASDPIVLATRSRGKLVELRRLFLAEGLDVVDLVEAGVEASAAEDRLEEYESFEENALAKARYFFEVLARRAVIAEDSGLEVSALDGAPGVRSKRWSERPGLADRALDAANNELLLHKLHGVADRRARYVCVAVFKDRERELAVRGETEGWIVEEGRGTGGFGYDPYFLSAELGRTFAEASADEKAAVSHRGRAFRELIRSLRSEGR